MVPSSLIALDISLFEESSLKNMELFIEAATVVPGVGWLLFGPTTKLLIISSDKSADSVLSGIKSNEIK